jgi:hypothetical protein
MTDQDTNEKNESMEKEEEFKEEEDLMNLIFQMNMLNVSKIISELKPNEKRD